MIKILLTALIGMGVLVSPPTSAQVSASSRITSTESNLMLHVREARSESGLAPSVQAKVGPVSYSSKEGFGLNVATVDVCADSLTAELPFALPADCQYNPSAFYPNLPATATIDEAQAQLNSFFSINKNTMAQYLRKLIKQNKTASAWYTFEAPLTVSFYTTTSSTDSEGNVTYQTISRQEERKVTWFLFADENGAAIAGNPKISDSTPEVIEAIFFPSNSQKFLDNEAIELPLGQIKWRKINSTTGAPLSAFVTENVGAAYDLPVNESGLVQEGISVQSYVACLVKNDACTNSTSLDVSDLLSREGASAAVVRYLTPAVISTFLISETPNADGTYNYREKVSLNVNSRVLDYQFSCVNPKYTNTGSYNVEMTSAMHTYTVNQVGEFNALSASPFSFQAYLSNKSYSYSTLYPAAQQSNLNGLIIDPLRSPQLASTSFYPGSLVAALEVKNKAEFCERPCGASTVTWRHLGQADGQLCTSTAPLVDHLGTRTVLATAENYTGSAQYRCDNGALSQINAASAQCVFTEPKKNCSAGTTKNWSAGAAQCSGANLSLVPHGGTTTISDAVSVTNTSDGSGTARYSCNDGTLTLVLGSEGCSVPVGTPPSSGGGNTSTPPTTVPDPTVEKPPVIPPILIPDGSIPDGLLTNKYVIRNPDGPLSVFDIFGTGVAVDGDYVFTNLTKVKFTATNTYSYTPYLVAFKFNGTEYLAEARIEVSDSQGTATNTTSRSNTGYSDFGRSIEAQNGQVIVSAPNEHPAGGSERAGAVRVFQYDKVAKTFSLKSYRAGTNFTGSYGGDVTTDGVNVATTSRAYDANILVGGVSDNLTSVGSVNVLNDPGSSIDMANGVLAAANSASFGTNVVKVWSANSLSLITELDLGTNPNFQLLNGSSIALGSNDSMGDLYVELSSDASHMIIGKTSQKVGNINNAGWVRVLKRRGNQYVPIADITGDAPLGEFSPNGGATIRGTFFDKDKFVITRIAAFTSVKPYVISGDTVQQTPEAYSGTPGGQPGTFAFMGQVNGRNGIVANTVSYSSAIEPYYIIVKR